MDERSREVALTLRQLASGVLACAAILSLLLAALINPLTARILEGPAYVDTADVKLSFFTVAVIVAMVLLAFSWRVSKGPSLADEIALLAVIVSGFVLMDRFILTRTGLTIWTHDTELHYKHRPDTVRSLEKFGRPAERVNINSWGFHDTALQLDKRPGEFRVLALGDSITMGYGLPYDETYSAFLEARAHEDGLDLEVINTGVHGYSTSQQRIVLERSQRFSPDLVLIGFCMNDVTEPFVVDKALGGTGFDYHGVLQTSSSLAGWIANETGFGRLTQIARERGRTLEAEKRMEVFNVRAMSMHDRTHPQYERAWSRVLGELDGIYRWSGERGIPIILVIFPFDFQLIDATARNPQAILKAHASSLDVTVIDLTEPFYEAVFRDGALLQFLRSRGYSNEEILGFHEHWRNEFYFDDNHFTSRGHELIAGAIYAELLQFRLQSGTD